MSIEDLKKQLEDIKPDPSNKDGAYSQSPQSLCPRCGYCPSCGRPNIQPLPYYPLPYWGWPYHGQPTCGSGV